MTHTRGPWQVSNRDFRGEEHPHNWYITGDHDGESCVCIATVHGNATAGTIPENNARRIAACVNGCRGIRTEALEGDVVRRILDAWLDLRDALALLEKRS